jgi:HSP20 family protein
MPKKWSKDPFDEMFHELYERLEEMLKGFEQTEPFVFGFSMTKGTGGEPEIREFGNVNVYPWGNGVEVKERKPLIDVFETEEKVNVIAEMPGIEKEDIKLSAAEHKLEITASSNGRKYSEEIDLPAEIDPDSAKANYKNGVLEVSFKKLKSKTRKSISVS